MTASADGSAGPRESAVGKSGRIVTPTRGTDGPGEVELSIRGGSEVFIARSARPLARGTAVLCVAVSGPRAVDVVPFDDPDVADPGLSGPGDGSRDHPQDALLDLSEGA